MNSRITLFPFVFFLMICVEDLYCQAVKAPKTIYELLHLQSGGCDLKNETEEISSIEMEGGFESTDVQKAPVLDITTLMKSSTPLFRKNAEKASGILKSAKDSIVFKNGSYLYKEGDFYGFKDNQSQILLPPQFHTVTRDDNNGFVAYKSQQCNYYTITGKKLLSQNYYSIIRTPKNTFIVQTASGYGVVASNQKFLIKPTFRSIEIVMNKNLLYYRIHRDADHTFYLPENGKDTIRLNCFGSENFIDDQYWGPVGHIVNVKTRRSLICENGYYLEVVSVKHHLARITDNQTRKQYLIDFNGNLIVNQPFENIGKFTDDDFSVVYTSNPVQTGYDRSEIYGIINIKGSFIVKPLYRSLQFVNRGLVSARGKNGFYGLISTYGDTLLAFQYEAIKPVTDSIFLCVKQLNNVLQSDLYQFPGIKLIKSQLPYSRISTSEFCGNSKYIAELKKGECVLKANFEPILPGVYGRIYYGPEKKTSFVAADFYKDGTSTKNRLFDCTGKLQTFSINGNPYESYLEITRITSTLQHILLSDSVGYFITSNGKTISNHSHWQNIEYSNAKDFYTTMVYGGKYGIINGDGETVIPPVFEYISKFDAATRLAMYDYNKYQKGLITSNGELLFGITYSDAETLGFGLVKVKKYNQWGVVTLSGNAVIPVMYSKVYINGGILTAELGNRHDYFDISGKRLD